MRIKYIKAKNFLSIGSEPVEIDFTKYGNIVNIKGENLDQGPGASNGAGKCFGLNTPIMMFDGTTKKVQDVQAGDFVMGPNSEPRRVLGLGRGREMMYKVSSSNGDSFVANESHILALKCSDKKKPRFKEYKKSDYWCVPIRDYIKSKQLQHLMRGTLSGEIGFNSRPIAVDPYILGVWLGDGTTDKIPDCYKFNSREVRLALLAGLIDTDGTRIGGTGYEITTKLKGLSEDIVFLCRSLGFNTKTVLTNKKCQTGKGGLYYRIYIKGDCDLIPVRIPYKQCQKRIINKNHLVNGIKVEPIGVDDYYGFQVEGDGLFLLGDFTVVHNSTVIEVIVYSLFGELMKNLNHKQAMNIKANGEKLEVEIQFDLGGHEYRIVRTRTGKHGKEGELKLWKDGVDESKGGIPATQEEVDKIIKLNHTAFVNVACFGQHNVKQFLACKPSDKRAIAENLLSLDKYNKYCECTKKKLKELNERLKYLIAVYEKSLQDIAAGERQVKQLLKQQSEWRAAQLNTVERLKGQIDKFRSEIAKQTDASSSDNYAKLQVVIHEIEEQHNKKAKIGENISLASDKINQLREDSQNWLLAAKESQYAANKIKKEIEDIESHNHNLLSQEGSVCRVCFGVINPANFQDVLKHDKQRIQELKEEANIHECNYTTLQGKRKRVEEYLVKLKGVHEDLKSQEMYCNKALRDLEQKKTILSSAFRENATSATLLLEQQIGHCLEQIEQKQQELLGGDPYSAVLKDTQAELEKARGKSQEFKSEMSGLEEQAPYYQFWIEAFGDSGIRSFVLREVMPILNARINYWLQFLVDNKIRLNFNNELEEKIERNPPDGDPFVYAAMSGGEHQRIDLGIALAFSQVMMLTANMIPSLVCLDEVGTNLDRPGIQAVYNAICELSRDRQVLVTTHDPDLLELLAGYEVIEVVKENGYTRLKK